MTEVVRVTKDEITERCRWAREHNAGRPSRQWPVGEQLAVALVLRDRAWLESTNHSTETATELVCEQARLSAFEFTGWLNDIRAVLESDRSG
ncbi:hypothetical protein CDG81_10590 [Actinopolyspora erythraea]|uniref:Uncharacterized protein n=1 Tax=Actinopolyspora erythraea TaxID=414996 RepID=A0A099D5F6_9ACTN|nr:hypothetical protein [Actinopolyspora erythraea]ASU78646.1 hypothetical protein CDG81_10590 [Actinopolyspora erythraea]KGI81408.1 hypothetical protein IL38_10615 [Actinopolyspora erythraea]